MAADSTARPADRTPENRAASAVRYLVVLPAVQSAFAPTAILAAELLGPGHPVTAALALGLLYATLLTGPLALLGLPLDARRRRRDADAAADADSDASDAGTTADAAADSDPAGPRWQWYAAAALALAAVLAHHGTYDGALFGLLEPALAVAAAMVPVGLAYHYRRWAARSARELA